MIENTTLYSRISIIVPVYNSSESLELLVDRLHRTLTQNNYEFEIILIDDCSSDSSWETLKFLKSVYGEALKVIKLLVNSGQHNAILCGLHLSCGDIVITMDDDLQNPPEEIPKLVDAVEKGFELVIGAYDSRKHSAVRKSSGNVIDWLLRQIFHLPREFQLTSFRATTRRVVDNVCQMGGVFPYITAMVFSSTSNYTNVLVRHDPRPFGRSNYNLKRSSSLAANLIFSYSSYPLYFVAFVCALAFLCALLFGTVVSIQVVTLGSSVPGWASTIIVVSFFNALTLLCLLVFGLYLSRISQQLFRTRISYTVSEIHE